MKIINKDPAFAEKRARDVLDIVKSGTYQTPDGKTFDISEILQFSLNHQDFLTEAEIGTYKVEADSSANDFPVVSVTNESATAALKRFTDQKVPAPLVLNFASAKNPGGGFLRGATAQEEDLCRSSCLYQTLAPHKDFYDYYQFVGSTGTGNLIYSPDVVFFKDENYVNIEPFTASVITCAAPNISSVPEMKNSKTVKKMLEDRIGSVLRIASHYGHRNLVLGAFGCGIFGNDPEIVAQIFHDWIYKDYSFRKCFDSIVFAVLDKSANQTNFKTFEKVFK